MKCLSGNFNKNYIQFISNRKKTLTHDHFRAQAWKVLHVCVSVCELYRRRSAGRDADSVFGMSVEHVQLGRGLTAQPIE